MVEKIELNAPVIESVRTNVPATSATPRTIATAVRAALSRRVASPLSATRSTALQVLHGVDDLVLVGAGEVTDELAVREEEEAIGDGRRLGVVGDHHHRLPHRVDRAPQEGEDLL